MKEGEKKNRTKRGPFTKRVTDGGRDEERVLQPKVGGAALSGGFSPETTGGGACKKN